MENHNWTTFKKRVPIKATKEVIFSAWSSQESLERWFLSKAEFSDAMGGTKNRSDKISKDDTYTWMWHGSESIEKDRFLKIMVQI